MAESESALLQRFAGAGDDGAFNEIVRRYAGLVYGTCLRVLTDADRAADATQETFFQLAKNAGRIRGSLGAWLHRVAVRQAVDSIRSDSARRHREKRYVNAQGSDAQTWHDVSPHMDEALDQLDGRTRELLVRHYLDGRSMTELAEELGVSRPTVSREIDAGLARVRAHLQRQGVLVTAAGLTTLLAENVAQSAPEFLLRQLGKVAMLGAQSAGAAGSTSASAAALAGGVLAVANTKLITAVIAVAVVATGVVVYKTFSPGPPKVAPPAPVTREDRRPVGRPTQTRRQEPGSAAEPQTLESEASQTAAAPELAPAAQPIPVQEAADSGAAALVDQTTPAEEPGLDFSTPEAAVLSFTRAIISGDAEAMMACMLPGGIDHEDMQELLAAGPDDPKQKDEYEFKCLLQSLDPDAEMPVTLTEQTDQSVSASWQVVFKKDATLSGHTFRAGDPFELDASLRKSGDSWLIDGF